MRTVKSIFLVLLTASFLSAGSYAAVADRIRREIDPSQTVAVKGNVHGLARPNSDLGRADASKLMQGVTLVFHPSAAQQRDLDNLLAEQQDRSSPNYHKWLTPAQFADRFGMSRADIQRATAWLQSQGFAVTSVSHSRNEISFDGTVSQIEVTFGTEIHNYLVNDEIHIANATDPTVPAALADSVLHIGHLHDFAPKPRAIARPHLTSFVTGNHFVSPPDFATIYDVTPLYNAGVDGSNQKIAVVGQSSVNPADVANFRSAAGLSANAPHMVLLPTTTSTRCAGDEGESDLDIEWSGGVAKNATIIFVYAGLSSGDTCANRNGKNVWDALDYAVQNNVAAFISTSYGFCESGVGSSFANQVRAWAKQANAQGQTIVAATGDSGAADCDGAVASASKGLAVDVPAAIPEVTGMGGNEFTGDNVTNTAPGADPPYWAAAGTTTDTVSSALEYIPEKAWNNTAAVGTLSASGGGASSFYTKADAPWQTGTGVPNDGKRDVPDLSLASSPDHDGYLVCSEDGNNGAIQPSCVAGFRDAAGSSGSFTVVGGTSVAAPTFSGILALINQQLGSPGFGNVNPNLYSFAAGSSSPFHDVTSGNNKVPCTSGTPNCPAGTTQIGFSAGPGYDQVTGLGSVDAGKLATAWAATTTPQFTLAPTAASFQVTQGAAIDATVAVTLASGFTGTITFKCTEPTTLLAATCTPPPATNVSGSVSFHIATSPPTVAVQHSDPGARIFYAVLFPGLLGIIVMAGSRPSRCGMRLLGLIAVLGLATLGLGSCGGTASKSNSSNTGTAKGTYTITVSGTSSTTSSATFQLVVQ